MKILAYFLPQFHTIPENDEWWGKDFTEWTTIRKENKISKNLQPLNNNYYNLLDEKTIQWQTELANNYKIYGFVYYHYYFCGKKLLQKPAELLLSNKNINQKFCFCWANHDWIKSSNNIISILMKQEYGTEKDWQQHFNYLLPFFKDERYIKIDNKPLFIIFRNFNMKEDIYKYFNKYANKNGLPGIYFAQASYSSSNNMLNDSSQASNAVILREPAASFNRFSHFERCIKKLRKLLSRHIIFLKYNSFIMTRITISNAKNFCRKMRKTGIKYWLGAYSGWDNTPRHGLLGYKMTNISNSNYIWYLTQLRKIAEKENIEFIFFNAWNEWAEGMILEPDTYNEYRFLEGIKQVFSDLN